MNISKTVGIMVLAGTTVFAAMEEKFTPSVGISGAADVDVVMDITSDGDITYSNSHDLDVFIAGQLSEKVSIEVDITANTYGLVDQGDRWTGVDFDGAFLTWEISEATKLIFGDMIPGSGYFNYYGYDATSIVVPEMYFRGAGIETGGFTAYLGVPDGKIDEGGTAGIYTAYEIGLGEAGSLTPAVSYIFSEDGYVLDGGFSTALAFGGLGISAAASIDLDKDMDPSFELLFEPSFEAGKFSIAATYYQAIVGSEPSSIESPEEQFAYIEPVLGLNDLFSLGLAFEFHNEVIDVEDDENLGLFPTLYIVPTEGVALDFGLGLVKPLVEDSDLAYGAFLSIETEF